MRMIASKVRWWRGLLAVALLLGLMAPTPATPLAPDWLSAAICHARSDDGSNQHQPAAAGHEHCSLCMIGHATISPPDAPQMLTMRIATAIERHVLAAPWPGPGPSRFYASRAPPQNA